MAVTRKKRIRRECRYGGKIDCFFILFRALHCYTHGDVGVAGVRRLLQEERSREVPVDQQSTSFLHWLIAVFRRNWGSPRSAVRPKYLSSTLENSTTTHIIGAAVHLAHWIVDKAGVVSRHVSGFYGLHRSLRQVPVGRFRF